MSPRSREGALALTGAQRRNTMEFGRLGVWTWLDVLPADEAVGFTQRRSRGSGYSDALVARGGRPRPLRADRLPRRAHRGHRVLHRHREHLRARRDDACARSSRRSASSSPGRFALGLGVSHAHLVAGRPRPRVREARRDDVAPTSTRWRRRIYLGPAPAERDAGRDRGAAPEHARARRERRRAARTRTSCRPSTRRARGRSSARGPLLAARADGAARDRPDEGARVARESAGRSTSGSRTTRTTCSWLGFDDADFANGGSDRLVDAIVAWGDEKAIAARIEGALRRRRRPRLHPAAPPRRRARARRAPPRGARAGPGARGR